MKKGFVLIIIFSFVIASCDKDECECYYSNAIGQYVMFEEMETAHLNGDFVISEAQLEAIQAECRVNKGCN